MLRMLNPLMFVPVIGLASNLLTSAIVGIKNLPQNQPNLGVKDVKTEQQALLAKTAEAALNAQLTATPAAKSFELGKEVLIDTVGDIRALGYTGQDKLAVDSHDNIYLTYRKSYKGNEEIFVPKLTKQSNGKYTISGTDKPISSVGGKATQRVSSVTVSKDDTVHVVWYGLDPNPKVGRQIKYSQSKDGGKTWAQWNDIAVVPGYKSEDYWQEHPQIITDENNIYVTWEGKDTDHSKQQIKFSMSSNGGKTFTLWKNVQPTPNNTQSRPSINIDSNGQLHLYMYSSQSIKGGMQQVWESVSKDNGKSWSKWLAISDPNGDARHIDATCSDQTLNAVWRQTLSNGGPTQILYSLLNNGNWSDPKVICKSENYQFFPSAAVNKNNDTAVAWMETADKSEFPSENPNGAQGMVSYKLNSSSDFVKPLQLSNSKNVLYPHLTGANTDNDFFMIYEKGSGSSFGIYFNILTAK
jgi:hypothetical protein